MRSRSYSEAEMAANRARKEAELRAQQAEWDKKQAELAATGQSSYRPMGQELSAGVLPPNWQGVTNPQTGQLLSQYTYDPYKGEATQALKKEAFSQEMSPWAQMRMKQQGFEQQGLQDKLGKQNLALQSQAAASMARVGGLGGGARLRMGQMANRDAMMANQMLQREGMGQRMGIQTDDLSRKQDLMQGFAGQEQYGQRANLGLMTQDLSDRRAFEQNRYNTQMSAYGAQQTANAQRSGGGGGGCCFIFLEARYGNGTMDKVVRQYRDEHMTETNQRGYYKLSEVLVPLMRESKLVKGLVRLTMTDPLVSYGKWHYGEGKIGWIFAPVKKFWMKVFNTLGGHTEFVRENGETV